jgi:hypothetical protein
VTTSCGCESEEYAQVDVLADEDSPDLSVDPRGDKVTVWSGLVAPVGVHTGDGRRFADNALSHRDLPVPLRWNREDEGGHKRAVVIGTVDEVEYRPDGVYASGVLFTPDPEQMPRLAEDVAEARMLLDKKAIGPSVDLDDMEYSVLEAAADDGPNSRPKVDVTKGRISGVTMAQIPAFAETRGIELNEVDAVAYAASRAVMASAGASYEEVVSIPGWTPSMAAAGADDPDLAYAVFAWSDDAGLGYYPIRQYREGRPVVVREAVAFALKALDFGAPEAIPTEEVETLRARFQGYLHARPEQVEQEEEDALVASAAPVAPPAAWFVNPELDGPTPLTVTADGRVFGHLATWRTCHTGFGQCVKAPKSKAKYAYFHTGEVHTEEGEGIAVGRITLGGGHADTRLGFQAAIEHYDNAGTCAALVRAGEDAHGIWLAGSLAPEVDELKAAALRRHPPSGDWRRIGGSLELVGALAVNTPGFPVPRSRVASGAPQALVAAGAFPEQEDAPEAGGEHFSAEAVQQVVALAVRAERVRERRLVAAADAFAEATERETIVQRAQRQQQAAAAFAMPAFIKEKIAKRKEKEPDEPDCDPDDEDCKKKKAGKKLPFGGKQAKPFGSK